MPGQAPGIGAVNWGVIIIYLAGMVAIGVWAGRRVKSSRGFFVAEGRMSPLLVGLSLLGTYLSSLTMMALPGKAFGPEDFLWTIQLPFLLVTAIIITSFVLPRYRQAGVISVYQFLEQRIHVSARLLASFCFLMLSIARMGLVLYLPALAISQITGSRLDMTILAMGLIVTLYSVIGGVEAVIWTDAVQVVVLSAAAVLSVGYVLVDIGAAGANFGELAQGYHKFRMWEPSLNVTKLCSTWLILETIFQTVRIFGTQQDMTQRYMATDSTAKANRSVWISILGYIPLAYMFYFIGGALYIYYAAHAAGGHPDPYITGLLAAKKPKFDAVYPYFMITRLPVGISGLALAGIWAAAQSTISSSGKVTGQAGAGAA